jgi:MFS family permease
LRQALDTVGAVLGPLIAVLLLWRMQFDVTQILWVACIPALITVAILAFGVQEPERQGNDKASANWREAFRPVNPGKAFWLVLIVGVAMSVARMSEAFLVLKAQSVGMPLAFIPLVMVLMSLVYLVAVYPTGVVADRWGTRGLLLSGLGALMVADVLLAQNSGLAVMLLGIAFWGLHMGLTQGLLGKLVADAAPANLRGTCFGYFNIACGLATLVSGLVAGLLWDKAGPAFAFIWSGAFALLCALCIFGTARPLKQ